MLTAIITTIVIWTVLLGCYHLFLSRQTFFKWNRYYLLGSLAIGLIVPWIEMPVMAADVMPAISANVQAGIQQVQTQLDEVIVTGSNEAAINGWTILLWIIAVGMFIRLARFVHGLWRIAKFATKGTVEQRESYRLIKTDGDHLPFSFFKNIYWGKLIELSEVDQEVILRHEQVHLRQGHSWDIVALEILLIPFWWCLPLYIYKKDIRELHEYLADAATLEDISAKNYKHLLLKYIFPGAHPQMAHAFTNFQLKKRLHMMTKKPSAAKNKFLYLLAIPLMIAFMSFKPVITTNWTSDRVEQIIGDPLTEAIIEAALTPALEKLKANPNDERASAMLVNQIKVLQQKYPAQKTMLLNTGQSLLKECESGIYLAKVNDTIMVKQDKSQVEGIFKEVDQMPHFPSCDDMAGEEQKQCRMMKMINAIYTNVKYPKEAREKGMQGTVLARFIVNETGDIESPEIVRSVAGGCDEEVIRVVESLQFVPGVKDGKNVNVVFNLPVKFKLEGDGKDKDKNKDKMKEKDKRKAKMKDKDK